MGGTGGGSDLLLGESELEASLPEVGGDRIGLTELADQRVFVAGVAVGAAAASAAGFGPLSGLSDGAVVVAIHGERTYQSR